MISKQKKLIVEPDTNFSVIGIVSSESCYKLAWDLGELFGSKFLLLEPYKMPVNNKYMVEFNAYESTINDNFPVKLVQNRKANDYLIEQLNKIDYFIIISPEAGLENKTEFLKSIKKLGSIQMATLIENISNTILQRINSIWIDLETTQ